MHKKCFKEIMSLDEAKGTIEIDKSQAAIRQLATQINDNVYKNIDGYSVLLFDDTQRYSKDEYTTNEKQTMVDNLLKDKVN